MLPPASQPPQPSGRAELSARRCLIPRRSSLSLSPRFVRLAAWVCVMTLSACSTQSLSARRNPSACLDAALSLRGGGGSACVGLEVTVILIGDTEYEQAHVVTQITKVIPSVQKEEAVRIYVEAQVRSTLAPLTCFRLQASGFRLQGSGVRGPDMGRVRARREGCLTWATRTSVSYTHLTLPTICSV
eukprot:1097851-Rhodomonas_salina.1